MKEIECFCTDLYQEENLKPSAELLDLLLNKQEIPEFFQMSNFFRCVGKLTSEEFSESPACAFEYGNLSVPKTSNDHFTRRKG